jgi:hypothetical protein
MRVFVVIATGTTPQKVLTAIQDGKYTYLPVKGDVWLVAFEGTTRELAEAIGIRGGENGPGLVCAIASYSGRLPNQAWEWLALHEAKSEG